MERKETTEQKLVRQEKERRAREAESLLSNELMKAAFEAMTQRCLNDFFSSGSEDQEKREIAYRNYRGILEFKTLLTKVIDDAKLAQPEAQPPMTYEEEVRSYKKDRSEDESNE